MKGLELRGVAVTGLPEPVDLTIRPGGIGAVVIAEHRAAIRLADVITGHGRLKRGAVLVDGRPVAVRRAVVSGHEVPQPAVSLVPAGGALLPQLSVAANIRYGLRHGDGMREGLLTERVRDIARQLRVWDVLGSRPADLTPGRRLRVGLARALLRHPRVVVLEDRTGAPQWAVQLTDTDPLAGVAVLIITDAVQRVAGLPGVQIWEPRAGKPARTGSGAASRDG